MIDKVKKIQSFINLFYVSFYMFLKKKLYWSISISDICFGCFPDIIGSNMTAIPAGYVRLQREIIQVIFVVSLLERPMDIVLVRRLKVLIFRIREVVRLLVIFESVIGVVCVGVLMGFSKVINDDIVRGSYFFISGVESANIFDFIVH